MSDRPKLTSDPDADHRERGNRPYTHLLYRSSELDLLPLVHDEQTVRISHPQHPKTSLYQHVYIAIGYQE
ncbi:hypothetical protein D3C71_2127170 [compost metagenome]